MIAFRSLELTMFCRKEQEIQIGDPSQQSREWLIYIMNTDGSGPSNNTISYPRMEKVPKLLRDQMQTDRCDQTQPANKSCYDPLVVSIGPYHHGKQELQSIEERKLHFARVYVSCCKGKSINDVYNEVADVACEARKCYEEGSTKKYNEATFTQMMFLDGCFILQFACQYGGEQNQEEIQMKSHEVAFARRDLFLLENQLPFKVLQKLMNLRYDNDDEGLKTIKRFIAKTRADPPKSSLCDMVEIFISEQVTDRNCKKPHGPAKSNEDPPHLLELWRRQLVNPKAFELLNAGGGNYWYSYRCVQELKMSGIHFRPDKSKETRCFTDARYEDQIFRAILRLPPMTIDDSTKCLLLNLVAHEMCLNEPSDLGVTSYVWFLDTLIDSADDVKELRKMGILLNYLGSDQLVAELFNGIAKNLVPNPRAFADLKGKIERHYKNKVRLWATEWLNTHFASPWSFAAFLGAIVSIIFSFIQAYKALYPSTAT